MARVNPEEVTRAMVSAEWAALLRLGTDLAGVATWDPELIRHPRLLVPVDVQALYVPAGGDERFVRLPFALTTGDGEPPEPMPEPFADGVARPPGVHLHWAMPDALLNGELREVEDASRNRLGLPPLPDRWVVLRLWVPRAEGAEHAAATGWVIEADTTRVVPLDQWPAGSTAAKPSGKTLTAAELTGSAGGTLNWTGVYDAVVDRFAFHDGLEDLADDPRGGALGGIASYVVAGWWSNAGLDPLDAVRSQHAFGERLGAFRWQVFSDREGGAELAEDVLVDAARRWTLGLGTGARHPGPEAPAGDLTLGVLSYEPVFSSFAEETNRAVRRVRPQHLYASLLHGVVHGVPVAGERIAIDQRPQAEAVEVALGLHGDDVAAALASASLDIDDLEVRRDNERLLAAFTGHRLDGLGSADGVVDIEEHEHASEFESRPGPVEGVERLRAAGEGEPLPAGRTARAEHARRTAGRQKPQQEESRLFFAAGERSDLKARSSAEQRAEVARWTDDKLGEPPVARAREVPRAGPRYYRPLEPIVAIRNGHRSLRHRYDGRTSPDGRLICRWPSQVPSRYEGVVDGADLVPHLPGSGVPPEVLTLARSAVVTDPYLTSWLAAQAERQSAVPAGLAEQRILAEVALRYGSDATYAGALGVETDPGAGERHWAGTRVSDQLRRFSLLAGVDADPVGVTAWSQPWVPLWLEWEVALTAIDRLGPTRLEALDLEPEDPAWVPDVEPRVITGRSPLNTGTATTLAAAIDDWIAAETARDAANQGEADEATETALADIADAMDAPDVLSASLSSLHEVLLGLPVGDYGVLSARDGEELRKPTPTGLPTLLVNGTLRLTGARLVDAFGRVLDLPVAATRIPARAVVADAPAPTLRLDPRLIRPARWLLRLVDPADLGAASRPATLDQVTPQNMVNPVAGFLLPDHIDEALEFFDSAGRPLGQLMHEPFGGGVAWEIAPGRPGPVDAGPLFELPPAQQILGHVAAALLAVDARVREGRAAPTEAESALSALLRAVDTTLWTVDSFAGLGTAHIAGLVGRPIAVVRATLSLDVEQDLDDFELTEAEREARLGAYRDLADRAFPVRIGELTRSDDGVLGFFVDDDYERFRVVDKAVRDGALESGRGRGQLAQRGSTGGLPEVRPIGHPYLQGDDELLVRPGQVVRLTILMHPAGKVHLTSGVLPRKALQLARDWTHPGLSVIAPSTRVGPVLIEPGEVRLPKISVFPKEQIWTRRDSPATWRDDPILAATQTALLPELPAQVQEGYIRIAPDPASGETS